MDFFKQAVGQAVEQAVGHIYNRVLSNVPNTSQYMYSIKEVEQPDIYKSWLTHYQDEGFSLLENLDNNTIEGVLYDDQRCSRAFSLLRLKDVNQAKPEFARLVEKLKPIVKTSATCYRITVLQRLCDCVRTNPEWSPAHVAVYAGVADCLRNNEISKYLDSHQCIKRRTPLHVACMEGQGECILELIGCGIDVAAQDDNGDTAYHLAARQEEHGNLGMLLTYSTKGVNHSNKDRDTPLHVACEEGRPLNAELLIAHGADVNLIGRLGFPLHSAMKKANIRCVLAILKDNPQLLYAPDNKYGGTPLHWSKNPECMELLLKQGCNVDAVSRTGDTTLHVMVARKRLDCVMALLCKGADVNAAGQDDNTPLHIAAKETDLHMVYTLIVFGADVNARNSANQTARHLASLDGLSESCDIIFALHAVGAQRCPAQFAGCRQGCCHGDDTFNGSPPDGHNLVQDSLAADYNHLVGLSTVFAALNASKPQGGGGLDCPDGPRPRPRGADTALALDGGGIRGLVLIQMLIAIEALAGRPIVDLFDWVGGTSTGGILALALVHGRKSIKDCRTFYFKMKDQIFKGKRPYDPEGLENVLREEFGDFLTMENVQEPKIIVTSVFGDRNPPALHLFRNYRPPQTTSSYYSSYGHKRFKPALPPSEQLVWRAARATGAAPTYFPSLGRILDGGIVANNPTLDLLTEIHEYNKALKAQGQSHLARKLGLVVSLGTGKMPLKKVDNVNLAPQCQLGVFETARSLLGAVNLGQIMIEQVTESDGRPVDRARAWCEMIDVPYFRFSPQLSLDVPLDETKDWVLMRMLWETECYLHHHRETLQELAKRLESI